MKTSEQKKVFFGTDGIRGPANTGKLSPEILLKLGQAAGLQLTSKIRGGSKQAKVLIGKDTRLSGDMVEAALIAGLTSVGVTVEQAGVVPTPAVALLTKNSSVDMGVMITASHNKFQDNGVKFFDTYGQKLSDEAELEIETYLREKNISHVMPGKMGRIVKFQNGHIEYTKAAKASFPTCLDLSDLKIVLDCAQGAAYQTAPDVLKSLGAKNLSTLGVSPDGQNINAGCGSTETALLSETVIAEGADVGIALDGDADRLIMCDEKGRIIDGDQLLALLTSAWHKSGQLSRPGLVATVMSNLGLERYVQSLGLEFIRTAVGDRHVAARMRQDGYNIGGEQSGHILLTDFGPTGDGLLAALQILAELLRQKKPASEVLNVFKPVPQILKNVRYLGASPLENAAVKDAIQQAQTDFGENGRVLVRASGTEPLIRVMAEGDDATQVDRIVDSLVAEINNHAA